MDLCKKCITFAALLLLVLLFIFNLPANAIEEPSKGQIITAIDFDDVLKKAKEHSYDLKIADYETMIAKTGIISARSEYFPKLTANIGTEYNKSFNDNNFMTTSVGDAFINPYTRYQSVIGISLSYNVFDFGIRRNRLDMAKEDTALKELQEKQALQELELNLVDIYTKILISKNQIENNNKILTLKEKNLEYTKRLYQAKEIAKTELDSANLEVLKTKKQILELSQILSESLNWLSFYTGESYDINNLKISNIKDDGYNLNQYCDYTKSIIWKIYDSELKKKDLEYKIVKKNNYPKVMAYSKYYLYGSDYSSYNDNLSEIEPSSFSVGANAYMPVFDGFQNSANIKKASLELQQLNIKRDKAIAEWMTRIATLKSNFLYLDEQIKKNEEIIQKLNEKEKTNQRLYSKRIINPMELNNAKIELLEEINEITKNKTTAISIAKGVSILTGSEL